ncbi:VanW family protein [Sporosarcina luteola]|uniref:VanW family protein n=1 Tax=Sporosarcina luteola TaxID=582850 RepID=UPI00203E0237|nr:VanW family protein [Sporosarcina luteola]MCM3743487.1 VanW family protein [Sporosarcina luteola]
MNKNIVTISISSMIVLILMSSVALASDFRFGKQFADHTYVGPFNISNSKTKQARSKLASNLSELQTKMDVNLVYQDTQFALPPETITFDIDMTLANANSGEDNPIIAIVSPEGLQTVLSQELPKNNFSESAINSISIGIEEELQTGIMPRYVHITDYLGVDEIQNEVLASFDYSIDSISPALSKAVHALDQSVIGPFESFSMSEVLTSPEIGPLTDEEMTLLSSVLYSAILQTNFQVDERNIGSVIPSTIQPGFEAAMNQTLGLDLKFTNPNKTDFTIRAAWTSGRIHVSIEGRPFYYTYEPSVSKSDTYKPRTVRQYSAFIDDEQVVVSQDGIDGVEAIVTRTLSVDGEVIHSEDISKDFYAPIHRIEIHPLAKENTSAAENTSETDNTTYDEAELPQNDGTQTSPDSEPSIQGEVGSNKTHTVDENSTNESADEEVIYDKSGLPISGK